MDFNDKVKDSLRNLLGLSVPDEAANVMPSLQNDISNVGAKASSGIDSTLQSMYASTVVGFSPTAYTPIPEVKYIPKLIIGSHDIESVLDEICKALDIQTVNNVSNTNLDNLRRMSAEHLAYFIVHESKKIVSGGGDATQELVEWLKSKPE